MNNIFFLFLVFLYGLIISCKEKHSIVEVSARYISEPLPNRAVIKITDVDSLFVHDKDCEGFFTNHFNPHFLSITDISKMNTELLNVKTGINWKKYNNTISTLNFNKFFKHLANAKGFVENKIVYVLETLVTGSEKEIILSIGSDDGFKLWVNGDSTATVHKGRGLRLHSNMYPIKLKKGYNYIIYKVGQGKEAWELWRKYLTREAVNRVILDNMYDMYSDIPESCILPDSTTTLPLKPDGRRSLDTLHRIKCTWKTLENKIIGQDLLKPNELNQLLKLPEPFSSRALFEVAVYDKNSHLLFTEKVPIFYESHAVILAGQLTDYYTAFYNLTDPVTTARNKAVKTVFTNELDYNFRKDIKFSTRSKLHPLTDLYYTKNNQEQFLLSPIVMGYRSKADSTVQSYRVFKPFRSIHNNKKHPVIFLIHYKYNNDNPFWEHPNGFSHSHMTNRVKLSDKHQTYIVVSHGRGAQCFTGIAEEELPIILDQISSRFPIDTTKIALMTWSSSAIRTLELVLLKHFPTHAIGMDGPSFPDNIEELNPILNEIKATYPDIKFIINHSTEDKIAPIRNSRKFVKKLKKLGLKFEFIEQSGVHTFTNKDPEDLIYGRLFK